VTLLFQLRDVLYHPEERWDLTIPFPVEAGAEMLALANAFEVFFAAANFRGGGDASWGSPAGCRKRRRAPGSTRNVRSSARSPDRHSSGKSARSFMACDVV